MSVKPLSALSLGLLADDGEALGLLERMILSARYRVGAALVASEQLDTLPEVDVWVVRVHSDDEYSLALIDRLETLEIPVLYDDAENYADLSGDERARLFAKKVDACVKRPVPAPAELARAGQLWVLAGSAGGPEAVIEFIKQVPADIDDVAFVYAQHIDEVMTAALLRALARHANWHVLYSSDTHQVLERCIYLLSPSHQIEFDSMGNLSPLPVGWEGPYSPSIDQVIARVARRYGKACGAIIFSGMGDDGAHSCRLIAHAGGQVWAQSAASCAVDSMPREATATRCVSFTGSPEELAQQFTSLFSGHHRVSCA